MVGGGDPVYLKFWVNRSPLEQILSPRSSLPLLAKTNPLPLQRGLSAIAELLV